MKALKALVVAMVGLLVATAGHSAIVDNSGPPMKKPELSDAEKEKQMTGPKFIPGGEVPNEPRKNAPGVRSDDDQRSALLGALGERNGDDGAEDALRQASQDVNGGQPRSSFVKWLLGAVFAVLGFGVVLALRRWSDRSLPPPGFPRRRTQRGA
jgi:hypothetical protein